jgi:hypothetical protein
LDIIGGLSGSWIEEAGCQAHEKVSSGERVSGEIDFPRDPNYIYSSLRLLFQLVAKSLEGKWGSLRITEKRRGTLYGVGHACGE